MDTARAVKVTGRVQGVGFRAWTVAWAEALGLAGWVRNESDGSVSALIAGPQATVDEMIEALGRGPRFARVDRVEQAAAYPPDDEGFRLIR